MKLFVFIVLLAICQTRNVISRNQKVNEMINELQESQQMYDQLISQVEQKMNDDYDDCTFAIKDLNCSNSEIWQQQRSKNSKNITNLQQKIKKHNQTIDAILQLNKHEVTKQNLTMVQLFPKIEKVKNDIELIENMMFLIDDTYLNLDAAGKSILLLFDHQFGHPKAQQMQKSFIQLMNSKISQQADELPESEPQDENKPAESKSPNSATSNQADPSGKTPLIDEDIFDGQMDNTEVQVENLFAPNEEEKGIKLYADEIPDGVNVKEHDANKYDEMIPVEEQKKKDEFDDLRIYEVKEDFKNQIKELGRQMHEQLELVLNGLNNELDQLTQSVADLEKAIMDLHHKHAKQIVQIYIETKKLQQTIFELDDEILSLDAQIFDCQNSNEKLELCETRKSLDQVVLGDLKTEKSFNEGVLKEMEKLLQFDDKNVYEPEPMQPVENVNIDIAPKSQDELQNDQENQAVQQRIASIKQEEKLVEQQLKEQNYEQQMENQQKSPEHLAEVPEIQQEVAPTSAPENINPDDKREEDDVLQQVEEELKEEQEATGEDQPQQEQEQNPAEEAQVEPQVEVAPEVVPEPQVTPEPKLELLRKSKKK